MTFETVKTYALAAWSAVKASATTRDFWIGAAVGAFVAWVL